MATVIRPGSMNEANERDPFNNNSYGTLVLNHGTAPHPSYARIADVLVTFEGTWATYTRLGPSSRSRQTHAGFHVPRGRGCTLGPASPVRGQSPTQVREARPS